MDESSLLDLLECSVCLERLDTTAKVLPCQHTFCRRCLENIVSSRHELRCPECRILVDCGVDDLPANILLVRLLDGIKQRPRNGGRASLAGMPLGQTSSDKTKERQVLSTLVFQNVPQLPCGKALYSYEGKEPGDLKFSKGDIIILRRKVDENWYHGELNGSHGFLPASYIQCIKPLSQTPPQGKALYDFEVKDKEQDKDCLTFTKGSPSRSPGPSVGRPLSMVASPQAHPSLQGSPLSPAAASTRPLLALSSAAVAVTPPNVSAAHLNGGEALGCSLTPVSPAHAHQHSGLVRPQGKEKKSSGLLKLLSGAAAKKKSRSPPSASPTHEPLPASADPSPSACVRGAAAPELHGRAGSCPIESEMQGAMGMEPLHRKSGSLDLNFVSPPVARQPCASALLAIRPEPKPLSRERYRVVVPYPPQSDAEIELKEGDIVFVHKKREDGWYKGTLQRTGRTGLFPGSFVESF
uniref:RING-type E3 ubiquitin transferase n=1 Tax=Electrophorus electricus TaxID=8005 RepID=A0AAY5EVU4_ELEEL